LDKVFEIINLMKHFNWKNMLLITRNFNFLIKVRKFIFCKIFLHLENPEFCIKVQFICIYVKIDLFHIFMLFSLFLHIVIFNLNWIVEEFLYILIDRRQEHQRRLRVGAICKVSLPLVLTRRFYLLTYASGNGTHKGDW